MNGFCHHRGFKEQDMRRLPFPIDASRSKDISPARKPDARRIRATSDEVWERQEESLDRALEETFPASDSIALGNAVPVGEFPPGGLVPSVPGTTSDRRQAKRRRS
jgi:hypothetical protein